MLFCYYGLLYYILHIKISLVVVVVYGAFATKFISQAIKSSLTMFWETVPCAENFQLTCFSSTWNGEEAQKEAIIGMSDFYNMHFLEILLKKIYVKSVLSQPKSI